MWEAADLDAWQGRIDEEDGAAGHRWHQIMQAPRSDRPGVCLLGFASDLGVQLNQGRPGAAEGPGVLRSALANLAAHNDHAVYDDGTVRTKDDLDAAQSAYADRVRQRLDEGHFVIGLGGGHEIGWASFQGMRRWIDQHDPDARVGIINFDAHFDLRKPHPKGTSGTPFRQVADWCRDHDQPFHYACIGISDASNTEALFQFAHDNRVRYLRDLDCLDVHANPFIRRFIGELDYLYVTICLDALPASVAPGVSAPSALGIQPGFLFHCLSEIQRCCQYAHCKWLISDVAELNPRYDLQDRTAKLAARIVWEIDRLQRPEFNGHAR